MPLLAVIAGIAVLLLAILVIRLHAFIALLIAGIVTGLLAGMEVAQITDAIRDGMGSTLGFVAVVIGLGAIFGAILETSGGAKAIAEGLLRQFGEGKASWALVLAGFLIAIPVFFDVALIILIPVIHSLQRRTGKSVLAFGIPLLAGLAVTHAFVPPTPGPVAVAEILHADLGMMIFAGVIAGLPAAIAGGVLWGRHISQRIHAEVPVAFGEDTGVRLPSFGLIFLLIFLPILLILLRTLVQGRAGENPSFWTQLVLLAGHPFTALILANLLAWYVLGIRRGLSREKLLDVSAKSFAPVGAIILLTGAGGALKEILVATGSGEMLATGLSSLGVPVFFFAFVAAVLVRVLQGSATVAMITSAGLTAPLLTTAHISDLQLACIGVAIAAGATFLSHINDSGFWLVSRYLGLNEKQTFRSWSVMTMIIGLVGVLCAGIVFAMC